jgi:hypothetical protein
MVDRHAALLHELLEVRVAERIGRIPADADQDHINRRTCPFEVEYIESSGLSTVVYQPARQGSQCGITRRMLLELQAEADRLEDLARPYEMPSSAPAATCSMRIIFDEAQLLFDALILADRSLHKLMHSPLAEVTEDNMGPFLRTFTVLRKEVFSFFDNAPQRADAQESLGN